MRYPPLLTRPRFVAVPQYPVRLKPPRFKGKPPQVDLRPTIESLGLAVRNQGGRGTCSVFAMTFLLEYAYDTRLNSGFTDLSEEYLNYVANLVSGNTADGDYFSNLDSGYQAWGMATEATEPYQSTEVASIPGWVLNTGRTWTRFEADFIKPWDNTQGASQTQLDRAIAYLDANSPVAFGGWWPTASGWGTTDVDGVDLMTVPPTSQKGTAVTDGHSVPLVGYRRDSTFDGGGYFVFRNSWGDTWWDAGYGYMPFQYVLDYGNDLVAYRTKTITAIHIGTQAVVAQPDRLDVFVTDSSGMVQGAAWQWDVLDGNWRDWWSIPGNPALAGTAVAAVGRGPDKLDLFAAGLDARTCTAFWDRNVNDGQWLGWPNILIGAIPVGGTVSAVSRDPNKLDIFLVSTDGGVYTAASDANVAGGQWAGWWKILDLAAVPGSPVAVVSRDPNKLDIFVAGADGKTYTAAWDANVANGQWQGWWNILDGYIPAGGTLTAVSRDPNKLDIFLVSTDGGIYTAAWDANAANGQWQGWWRITDGVAAPGSAVASVSRDPNKLDVFVIGTDNGIYTAAWDANVANGQWRGWWKILDGVAGTGSGVAAVSRDPNKLDIFIVGTDGAVWTAAWDANVANGQWRGWWRVEP
ncbi:MAG TPA: C1 family peptidase [Terriglobia bacterium]|nr:C1 family peptidase [Terriglobia bacterium]